VGAREREGRAGGEGGGSGGGRERARERENTYVSRALSLCRSLTLSLSRSFSLPLSFTRCHHLPLAQSARECERARVRARKTKNFVCYAPAADKHS
jgi:hypothetical protein